MKVRENPVFTVNMYLLIRQRIDLDRSNQLIGQQETLQKVQMEREGIIAGTSCSYSLFIVRSNHATLA
jgi:hypothetical protein